MAKKVKEKEYTREAILASSKFKGYQEDFLRAILTEPYYTITAATNAVVAYFMKKEN